MADIASIRYGNLYNSYIDFIEESYPVDLAYLYEIPGGMVRFPKAFYDSLVNPRPSKDYPDISLSSLGKVHFKGGCWVKGISYSSSDQKVVLSYENSKIKDSLQEKFDYVICAIPFSSLRNVKLNPLFTHATFTKLYPL